jgi:hypothetical protein
MTKFESYLPETWFRDGLIVVSDFESPKPESHATKRSSPWDIEISRVLTTAAFAVSAVLFSAPTAAASSMEAIPVPGIRNPGFLAPPKPEVMSPLRAINREFNALFESMRDGTKVIALADMRELAKQAVVHRDEKVDDLDAWARQLADDVKDADD